MSLDTSAPCGSSCIWFLTPALDSSFQLMHTLAGQAQLLRPLPHLGETKIEHQAGSFARPSPSLCRTGKNKSAGARSYLAVTLCLPAFRRSFKENQEIHFPLERCLPCTKKAGTHPAGKSAVNTCTQMEACSLLLYQLPSPSSTSDRPEFVSVLPAQLHSCTVAKLQASHLPMELLFSFSPHN